MFTACLYQISHACPQRLSIFIKSKGKESLPTSATSFFYTLHKITITNVTFSFNSVTITKVKVKVQVSRLRHPGFHSTGFLFYLENIVCHFLSINVSHRTGQLSKRLRPRCRMEVAVLEQNCHDSLL
jgi:hypothetical protein